MTSASAETVEAAVAGLPAMEPTGETRARILVAGIGNIFFSDDGFGVEVAERLAHRPVPEGVKVVEFGIRGLHLAFELLDGYDALVLVDAMPLGEAPGTVALVRAEVPDPATDDGTDPAPAVDAHTMSPAAVLASLANLGGSVDRVYVVGCQPATVTDGIGLSPTVTASLDLAVSMVDDIVSELLRDLHPPPPRENQP